MKKLMMLSYLVLCLGETHALTYRIPTYELPERKAAQERMNKPPENPMP